MKAYRDGITVTILALCPISGDEIAVDADGEHFVVRSRFGCLWPISAIKARAEIEAIAQRWADVEVEYQGVENC